jgi:hypothetical protein
VNTTTLVEFEELKELEREKKLYRKVALDFSNALGYCYNSSSSPYIGVFEGDVIFANGWLARSLIGVHDIAKRTAESGKKWLDMRLFNHERNIGFASNKIFGNNVPLIILGVSGGTFFILQLLRYFTAVGQRIITISFLFVICCITIPLFITVFFQSGKASVLPPAAGVKLQPWGCCTQGIILPREQVTGLMAELVKRASTPPDLIVNDYARDNGMLRYALDPVQIQHMG